jgi:hypothetical protein
LEEVTGIDELAVGEGLGLLRCFFLAKREVRVLVLWFVVSFLFFNYIT